MSEPTFALLAPLGRDHTCEKYVRVSHVSLVHLLGNGMFLFSMKLVFERKSMTEELHRIFTDDKDSDNDVFEGFPQKELEDQIGYISVIKMHFGTNLPAGRFGGRTAHAPAILQDGGAQGEDGPGRTPGRRGVRENDHEVIVLSDSEEESLPPKKRKFGLRIALQFPSKKLANKDKKPANKDKKPTNKDKKPTNKDKKPTSIPKVKLVRNTRKEVPANGDTAICASNVDDKPDSDGEKVVSNQESTNALTKRAMNIKENKAMLAQLLAELNSMPELFPVKSTTPSKQKKTSRRTFSEGPVERRTNPSRSARPKENFAMENFTESALRFAEHLQKYGRKELRHTLSDEDREEIRRRRRSSKNNFRAVEDITEEELDNVAVTVKDKIYDKILHFNPLTSND
ncbi:unnamed protein product [Ranitomeya imitator]|uniref:Uncharacterized protein n=1 Tax=Ranitomeya imitator TaxID=111125 RepID=A0ABN9MEU5_9NEOB|nr:unnamed protein product [Ranitomeya imitator]